MFCVIQEVEVKTVPAGEPKGFIVEETKVFPDIWENGLLKNVEFVRAWRVCEHDICRKCGMLQKVTQKKNYVTQ